VLVVTGAPSEVAVGGGPRVTEVGPSADEVLAALGLDC
jgi:hypothetical protein